MSTKQPFKFTVNSAACTVEAHPMRRLLDVLREDLRLTGTKEGCGEGECGACSVLLDGELVNSCLVPIAQVQDSTVITIEGLASHDEAHVVQRAFAEAGGSQCGICTPGMIIAAAHLLSRCPNPTIEQIREALAGNLCRCTGYGRILEAVQIAAAQVK